MKGELIAPSEALEDEKAEEVLRAWIVHEKFFCVLRLKDLTTLAAGVFC